MQWHKTYARNPPNNMNMKKWFFPNKVMEPSYNTSCRNRSRFSARFSRLICQAIRTVFRLSYLQWLTQSLLRIGTGPERTQSAFPLLWQSFTWHYCMTTLLLMPNTLAQAKPCLRLLAASLSPPRPQFNPRPDRWYLWTQWQWDRVFSKDFGFPVTTLPPVIHTHFIQPLPILRNISKERCHLATH